MKWMWALALATGCQENITTAFPPGLEPFDDDAEADVLAHDGSESFVTRGVDSDMIRVYGRGFIHAPLDTVWAAAREPQVLLATCNTTSQTVTPDNEPQYEYSFLVHYFVDDILNVEWDDQWRGAAIDIEPPTVMLKHQKVFGSDFITLSEGTIRLRASDAGVTELLYVEHLDATQASTGDVVTSARHTYDALRARTYGGAIPSCARVTGRADTIDE